MPALSVSATELRQQEIDVLDSLPVVTRCMFCTWQWQGSALEGRTIALTHRQDQHPDLRPKRRRHHRTTFNPSFNMHREDQEQIDAEIKRRARLNGVTLEE